MGKLINHEYETYIENGEVEIPITVCFDYEPYEPSTRFYPGNTESVDVYFVHVTGDENAAMCLLPDEKSMMEEKILEEIVEYRRQEELDSVIDNYY